MEGEEHINTVQKASLVGSELKWGKSANHLITVVPIMKNIHKSNNISILDA